MTPDIKPVRRPTSHELALAYALMHSSGRVLELGCGWGSTPWLHTICAAAGRQLVSCDNNVKWVKCFASRFAGRGHKFLYVRDWAKLPLLDGRWSVALVDQAPVASRGPAIARLRGATTFIVAHDWGKPQEIKAYGYTALPPFRWSALDRSCRPFTVILSDWKEIALDFPTP